MRGISPHIQPDQRLSACFGPRAAQGLARASLRGRLAFVTVAPVFGALTVCQNRYPSLGGRLGMSPCQPPRLFSLPFSALPNLRKHAAGRAPDRRLSAAPRGKWQSFAEKNIAANKGFTEPFGCSLVTLTTSPAGAGGFFQGAGTCNYTNGFSQELRPSRSAHAATPSANRPSLVQARAQARRLPRAATSRPARLSALRPTSPIAVNTPRAAKRAALIHTHGLALCDPYATIGARCAGGLFVANNAGGSRRPRT